MPAETNLVAVMIGAASGIAGQLMTQIFGHLASRTDRRHKRYSLHTDRLEEMTEAVTKTLAWLQNIQLANSTELVLSSTPPLEYRRITTIASLYFPDLVVPARDYCNGLIHYYNWCIPFYNQDIPAPLGAQVQLAILNSNNPDELKEIQQRPLALRNSLDAAIAREARKYVAT